MKYLYILLFIVISGCTPQKRINRILERHPQVLAIDSIIIHKEIIIPGRTVPLEIPAVKLFSLEPKDTIKLNRDSVDLIITRNQDSVFLKVVLPDQSSELDTMVYYDRIKKTIENHPVKWSKIIPWLMLLLVLSIIFRNFFRRN